jgi:hypothetical protein
MKNKIYAIINSETNIVENVIVWDGRTEPIEITEPEIIVDSEGNEIQTSNMIVTQILQPWKPPANCYPVCIDDLEAGIGWKYENQQFTDVRPVTIENEPANE